MISFLSLALAGPIDDAVSDLVAVTGWSESSPYRMRPSTIRARLEALAPPCPVPVVTTYGAGAWSGVVAQHPASGTMADGVFRGALATGAPVSDGTYTSQGIVRAHIAGSRVDGIYIREQGATGAVVALGGCARDVFVAGQSNAGSAVTPLAGQPITSGAIYVGGSSTPSTTYPARIGPALPWMDAGFEVVQDWKGGSRIRTWLDARLAVALQRVDASGLTPGVTIWVQGESDTASALAAAAYADRFADLADRIEADLGPQVFVWPRLHPTPSDHAGDINDDMEALALTRDDLVLVDVTGLERPDGIHYAHATPREDGSVYRLGLRMLDILDVW